MSKVDGKYLVTSCACSKQGPISVFRAWENEVGRNPIPIVALTASAVKDDREMCLAAGCTGFLTKPLRQKVLLQAIREHGVNAVLASGAVKSGPSKVISSAERIAQRSAK